jgi:hypothetical protein
MSEEQISVRTMLTADGAALLNIRLGEITTLHQTEACIWQGLERGDSAETIAVHFAHDTGEELSIVEQGATAFLTELRDHHLQKRRIDRCGCEL